MYIAKKEIEDRLTDTDKVLDLGSWNDVFPRANVIIDINPFETRKNKYPHEKERFNRASWIQSDVNKIETWSKFKDKEFDFAICSHLLEDIRDPLFVCEQLIRVAKAGYIEVPTRFRECSRANSWDTVSGYDHHRWLVDVVDDSIVFTAKLHWSHTIDYLTDKKRGLLNFHNFHYFGIFWDNAFSFHERCPKGELLEGANLLYQFDCLNISKLKTVGTLPARVGVDDLLWVDQFLLPIEQQGQEVVQSYIQKYETLTKRTPGHNSEYVETLVIVKKLARIKQLLITYAQKFWRRFFVFRTWLSMAYKKFLN